MIRRYVPPSLVLAGLSAGLLLACRVDAQGDHVTLWREGEEATRTAMNRHPWWYDQVKQDQLSGGQWLSNFSDEKEDSAEYDLTLPRAGEYAFWLRANPTRSTLLYRFDQADWRPIDFSGTTEVTNLAADGKAELRFIGWVKVGSVNLTAGAHTLAFRMTSELHHHVARNAPSRQRRSLTLTARPPRAGAAPGETCRVVAAPGRTGGATGTARPRPRRPWS